MLEIINYNFLFILALLFGGQLNSPAPIANRHIGCIDSLCDLVGVVQDAYENARFLCDQYYLDSPKLIVTEHNGKYITLIYNKGVEMYNYPSPNLHCPYI